MKISKTLDRPTNWQDFESLCKKLWGEIWNCPETVKNGRNGQKQKGVDVYDIPSHEQQYYGIQCKGKDLYTHKQFTEKEINKEIEEAKCFVPPLKKLYLTTTAVRNAKISEIVRLKNIEHIENNLFEVHLFSWEDIVELICENRNTYDYYVNSNSFIVSNSARITFSNYDTVFTSNPKFKQRVNFYTNKASIHRNFKNSATYKMLEKQRKLIDRFSPRGFNSVEYNHSFDSFKIKIHNAGSQPIENYKLIVKFEDDITEISDTKIVKGSLLAVIPVFGTNETFIDTENKTVKIIPKNKILVSDDSYESDEIFFKPKYEQSKATIYWKLLSKSLNLKGTLIINIEPNLEKEYEYFSIEDNSEERIETGVIEDFISNRQDEEE
ncbi:hypothetical protein U8527_08695 [Kordia algicida OT-1]|uniref:Mrr-like domain-containing protein n=1 Tax=Kordia algicida OT-1 TaxID=391587 RepID=A9E6V6_9FLAO|nr:hypothetical protein [Kordia algicida]EDP95093.1 hypothetical protein KAOT1_02119 [Kordia algicida OT-1]